MGILLCKDYNIWGSILGSPYFGKEPYSVQGLGFMFYSFEFSAQGVGEQGIGIRTIPLMLAWQFLNVAGILVYAAQGLGGTVGVLEAE